MNLENNSSENKDLSFTEQLLLKKKALGELFQRQDEIGNVYKPIIEKMQKINVEISARLDNLRDLIEKKTVTIKDIKDWETFDDEKEKELELLEPEYNRLGKELKEVSRKQTVLYAEIQILNAKNNLENSKN